MPIRAATVGLEPHITRLIQSNIQRQGELDVAIVDSLESLENVHPEGNPTYVVYSIKEPSEEATFIEQISTIEHWKDAILINLSRAKPGDFPPDFTLHRPHKLSAGS